MADFHISKVLLNPYNPPPLLLESLDSLSFLLLFTMELDLYDFRFLAVGLRKINGGGGGGKMLKYYSPSHLFKRKHENSRDESDGGENLFLDS